MSPPSDVSWFRFALVTIVISTTNHIVTLELFAPTERYRTGASHCTKKSIEMGLSENSVPLHPMVLLIIIPFLNGYFIGGIPHFQTYPNQFSVSIRRHRFLCSKASNALRLRCLPPVPDSASSVAVAPLAASAAPCRAKLKLGLGRSKFDDNQVNVVKPKIDIHRYPKNLKLESSRSPIRYPRNETLVQYWICSQACHKALGNTFSSAKDKRSLPRQKWSEHW